MLCALMFKTWNTAKQFLKASLVSLSKILHLIAQYWLVPGMDSTSTGWFQEWIQAYLTFYKVNTN